uniref:Chemokine interleukin-8-like domain-containing protein n=1 Tax=Oreochromis aureus TaxID=47969 RepID=A0A668S5W1_OREAU
QISMRCCRGVSTNGPTVSRKYCCTRYQQKPVPVKWLKSYTVQDDNCNIRAIIFKTVKNRHICANPEDNTRLQQEKKSILQTEGSIRKQRKIKSEKRTL